MAVNNYCGVSENRKRRKKRGEKKSASYCLLRLGLPPAKLQAESHLPVRNVLTPYSWGQQQGNCILSTAKAVQAYPMGIAPYHLIGSAVPHLATQLQERIPVTPSSSANSKQRTSQLSGIH